MAEGIEEPSYMVDESAEPGFVRLKLKIPNLKAKSAGIMGIFKDKKPAAKNATVDDPVFEERSMLVRIKGDAQGSMKGQEWMLKVNQLPGPIIPNHSYIKLEDGWCFVFLKKENDEDSWETQIRRGGIETAE